MPRKKAKSPAFQFYPNDWLSSPRVAAMSPEEEGAYIRLLCYAWMNPDCAIPDDPAMLAKLTRLGERWLNGCSQNVLTCFVKRDAKPGYLFNERLLVERKKQQARSKQQAEAGAKSGQSRRSGTNKCSTDVEQDANETPAKTNSSSSSSSSSSTSVSKGDVSPFNPLSVALPVALQGDEFKSAWASWVEHRKQIKKRLTELAVKQQLESLAALGPLKAVAAINHSIAQGWTGIFPAKDTPNGKRTGDNPERFDNAKPSWGNKTF